MQSFNTASTGAILSTQVSNRVLRNAYGLLAIMMAVGAGAAWFAASLDFGINRWVFLLVAIGFPFIIHYFRNSVVGLGLALAYSAFLGAVLGPVIKHYAGINPMIPVHAFMSTSGIFVGVSLYAMTTKRDFSFLGGFLAAASILVLLSIVAIMFFNMSGVGVVLSGIIVLLATAYILYDTQQIVRGGETNYITAATSLFSSIWSLMANLMHIFGFMSED
jgi:modulator of FtsH protease